MVADDMGMKDLNMDPLCVDIYEDDLGGHPDIAKLVAAGPPWHVLAMKASEGLYYPNPNAFGPRSIEWFRRVWNQARDLAGDRPRCSARNGRG